MWRWTLISAWVILHCASSAPPLLPFIFLQKHLWVLAAAYGTALEPCARVPFLSRYPQPAAGAACPLALEAWEESHFQFRTGPGCSASADGQHLLFSVLSPGELQYCFTFRYLLFIKKKQKRGTQCHIKIVNSFNVDESETWYFKKRKRTEMNMAHLLKRLTTMILIVFI